jgi:hypothetical protein
MNSWVNWREIANKIQPVLSERASYEASLLVFAPRGVMPLEGTRGPSGTS